MASHLDTFVASSVVVPNDSTLLGPPYAGAVYVGVSGDITMQLQADSAAVLFKAVPAGTVLKVRPKIIKSTGTTATNLILLS